MTRRPLPGRAPVRTDYPLGTRLEATDLCETREHEAALLALHVRGVHGAWGIARGLAVESTVGGAVIVGPGIAFDCHGQALTLVTAATLPPPPGRRTGEIWTVLLESAPRCSRVRVADCDPGVMKPLPSARAAWRRLGDTRTIGCEDQRRRTGVPLARFRVASGGALVRESHAPPRAHRSVRPPLGAGAVVGASLDWRSTGYQAYAWVDTREAGFATDPIYTVRAHGVPSNVAGPFLTVASATPQRFQMRLVLGAPPGDPAPDIVGLARDLTYTWLGVEQDGACTVPSSLAPGSPWSWDGRPLGLDFLLNLGFSR